MIDQVSLSTGSATQALLPGGNGALAEISAREFERLALLLQHAERGAWAFCAYNVAAARDAIVDQLRARLHPLPIYEFTLSAERPNPRDYLDYLPETAIDQRAVIVFYDAWRAFDAGFFGYLDLQREQFWKAPHSLIFWIREADRALLARRAPNFFSRHSGVFDFQVTIPFQAEMLRSLSAALPATWDSVAERERLERLYIGLLHEYESDSEPDQATIADLLGKLASIWYYSDRFDQAEAALRRRLEIAHQLEDRSIRAQSLLDLGKIAQFQDDLAGAGAQYQAALADFQALGARLGAANTYFAFGELFRKSKQYEQATAFYEKALAEQRAIGERLGQANTIDSMGELAEAQEQWQAARDHYAAALQIYRTIGDSYANVTARNLARVEARLGGAAIPDETQQAVERLLAQWQPVIRLVVAAAQGDSAASQQIMPFLQEMSASPDWRKLASALQQLVSGERDVSLLARGLDETDQLILAATLASMG